MKSNRDDLRALSERISQLAAVIAATYGDSSPKALSDGIETNLTRLTRYVRI